MVMFFSGTRRVIMDELSWRLSVSVSLCMCIGT